jgi:hypothetical protein
MPLLKEGRTPLRYIHDLSTAEVEPVIIVSDVMVVLVVVMGSMVRVVAVGRIRTVVAAVATETGAGTRS